MIDTEAIKAQVAAAIQKTEETIAQLAHAPQGPQRVRVLAQIARLRDRVDDLLLQLPKQERQEFEKQINALVTVERSAHQRR